MQGHLGSRKLAVLTRPCPGTCTALMLRICYNQLEDLVPVDLRLSETSWWMPLANPVFQTRHD